MFSRRFARLAFVLVLFAGAASAQNLVSRYVEGQDYTVAEKPAPAPADGKVHVAEFFLYSCPHCYHFEPTLEAWQKKLPDDVVFTHIPVLFSQGGEIYARLYYTEEQLGVLDKLHDQVFDAIHKDGDPLSTEADIRGFMVKHGVDGDRFDKAFHSDAVEQKVAHAAEMMQRLQVMAVPSMTVDGKYWVSGRTAGSNERMLDVVDYLIKKARADDAKS